MKTPKTQMKARALSNVRTTTRLLDGAMVYIVHSNLHTTLKKTTLSMIQVGTTDGADGGKLRYQHEFTFRIAADDERDRFDNARRLSEEPAVRKMPLFDYLAAFGFARRTT